MSVVRSFFFFFQQKTSHEMRISDWSSDVCSSDLVDLVEQRPGIDDDAGADDRHLAGPHDPRGQQRQLVGLVADDQRMAGIMPEIGRASCRERVCQYV